MIYLVSYGQDGVGIMLEGLLNKIRYQKIQEIFDSCAAARVFMLINYEYAVVLKHNNRYEVKESTSIGNEEIVLRMFSSKNQASRYVENLSK
ncbi:MAG: hypothetical protein IJH39_06010 [Clostridia bacterium]|nr:hypothetical protein [Clostridia bacterium]